jgi:outer membrane biosynthesis protein TonB
MMNADQGGFTIFAFAVIAIISAYGATTSVSATHVVGFDYPDLAHMAGVQGVLKLSLQTRDDGSVGAVKVLTGC